MFWQAVLQGSAVTNFWMGAIELKEVKLQNCNRFQNTEQAGFVLGHLIYLTNSSCKNLKNNPEKPYHLTKKTTKAQHSLSPTPLPRPPKKQGLEIWKETSRLRKTLWCIHLDWLKISASKTRKIKFGCFPVISVVVTRQNYLETTFRFWIPLILVSSPLLKAVLKRPMFTLS